MGQPAQRRLLFLALLVGTLISVAGPMAPLGVAAGPQTPRTSPTVDQILARYVQALGGEEAYHKLKTRVMKGVIHVTGSGELGSIEFYGQAPNQGTSTTFFPGDIPVTRGYNGSKGWYVDPDSGPQDANADALADLQQEFDFFREIRLKEIYPGISYKGMETVNGRPAYSTEAARADGSKETFFFDTETGLLIRHDVSSPEGGVRENFLGDYRAVDGILYPFRVQMTDPEFEAVIEYKEIRHNVPLEEAKFEKPAPK